MPAPNRQTPYQIFTNAINPTKGIVGYYSAEEIDAMGAAVTKHDRPLPAPTVPTPSGLESAFADYADGLHSFAGTLVSIERKPFQTTIVITGATSTVARIVKSELGESAATNENPSTVLTADPKGSWVLMSSALVSAPFDSPRSVSLFDVGENLTSLAAAALAGLEEVSALVKEKASKQEVETAIAAVVAAVDLTECAKLNDNTQNIVANATVAKGYAFGDAASTSNPGLLYTDTGEGYGLRLVLDTPAGVELIPYQSDFEPIKDRLTALEDKTAPTVDLSPYVTLVDADARYGARTAESVSLLQGQVQSIFDSVYTRPEADDRYAEKAKTYTKTECDGKYLTLVDIDQFAYRTDVYTQKQTDDRFMRIDQAFSKADFDNQMALMLYSRKQVDDKLTAISPLGAGSINDPALSAFKTSILDEVRKMMAGGATVPADLPWTACTRVAGTGLIEARVLNGMIQLRGELTYSYSSTGTFSLVQRLPANFPKPKTSFHSIAYGIQTGSTYRRCFIRWEVNGDLAVVGDGAITLVDFTGAQAYAY